MPTLVEINGLDEAGQVGDSIFFVRVAVGLPNEQHIILRNIEYFDSLIATKDRLRGYEPSTLFKYFLAFQNDPTVDVTIFKMFPDVQLKLIKELSMLTAQDMYDVKKLYGKFGQSEVEQETAAQLWGHKSAKSSQFRFVKLGSLRNYGLIEGRGKIKVSDLGKRLTFPENDKEGNDAIVEAIKNVPLWKTLFDNYTAKGEDLPTDTFWMDLRRIVGEDELPPEEAKTKAEIIRKAYFEDLRYFKLDIKLEKEGDELGLGKIDTSTATSEGVLGRVTVKDAGFIDVKDKATYEIAKAYLKLFAERLKVKDENEEES